MKQDKFDRAREINSIRSYLDRLYNAVNLPYPRMLDENADILYFIDLGKKYEQELRDLIINFIKEKNEELDKEFKEL